MKKIKVGNIIFLLSFLIALSVSIWLYFQLNREIGDITFQKRFNDNPNFTLCPDDKIYQYYSVGTSYKGERRAIRRDIYKSITTLDIKDSTFSGYITARFIVNCEGDFDRMRIKSIDSTLKHSSISIASENLVIDAIRKLERFKPGESQNGKTVNSYFQINFNVKNGKITDVF